MYRPPGRRIKLADLEHELWCMARLDNLFDPIEAGCASGSGSSKSSIRSELGAVLARPHYGRRLKNSDDANHAELPATGVEASSARC